MNRRGWKIGELARRVGITVRTLHHYDHIGLLSPSSSTEAGHRVYSDADVRRLLSIISLKRLGFSLREIKVLLSDAAEDPRAMLQVQLARLDEQIAALTEVRAHVQRLHEHLEVGGSVAIEELMAVAHALTLTGSPHFRRDEVEQVRQKYLGLDPAVRRELFETGRRLVAEFRRYFDAGIAPDAPAVTALARRWKEVTGSLLPAGEPLTQAAEQYYRDNPDAGLLYGMDVDLYRYIKQAASRV